MAFTGNPMLTIDKQLAHKQLDEIIARLEQENNGHGGSCWLELIPVRWSRADGCEYHVRQSDPFANGDDED